ncbi:MAG: FtsQ-type POTRA domain-containing protein [bacterium]|nr:FtsQ-type POTRA domain-containing protein [bacterium]
MIGDILASSRQLRRKRRVIKASLILFCVLLFIGIVIAFFNLSKFRIRQISIEGAIGLDQEQLKGETLNFLKGKYLKLFPYDNIFILPEGKLAADLSEIFPLLKEIVISRDFPQKISIAVEERKAEALWCAGSDSASIPASSTSTLDSLSKESCAFADDSGFIFQPAPNFSGAIFLKFFDEREQMSGMGKMMTDSSEFKKLSSFAGLLKEKGFDVSKIILKDAGIYEVHLKEGWYILLNDKNEPDQTFGNLELILDQDIKEKRPKLDYIDLRFGKKVFYKFK